MNVFLYLYMLGSYKVKGDWFSNMWKMYIICIWKLLYLNEIICVEDDEKNLVEK